MPSPAGKHPRTCFFNSCKSWGGGEKWHFDMAVRLADEGFPVVAAVYPGSELALRLQQANIPHFEARISNLSFLNPWKIWKIRRRLRGLDVGSIILNLPSDVKAAGLAARSAGVRNIIYRRGSAIPVRNTPLNRFLFRHVIDRVVANSEATKQSLLQENSELIAPQKIHVIYNGIDLGAFEQAERNPLYRPFRCSVVLGTAGRLETQKNQRFLIEVAALLKKRGVAFKLLIAGKGSLENELRRLAGERGVDEEIIFTGFVENIRAFMESLDIFLLSSHWEGFGYVLIEAMASGKPVVTLNNSNESEIVANGETGFLIQHPDPLLFTDKILHLIRNDAVRRHMGRQGQERVAKHFTMQRALAELKELLYPAPRSP